MADPTSVNPQITDLTKEADPKGKKTEDKDKPKEKA